MQDRYLCSPPDYSLAPQCPPYFFHSRIATGCKAPCAQQQLECEYNANLRTVRQMLRVLSQLASDHVSSDPIAHVFSVWLLGTNFQLPHFLFSNQWQHIRRKYDVPTTT